MRKVTSVWRHSIERDARQIEFHYDLSDDFYALWLDPRRVYSCAYYRTPDMTLAQAQEAKLDHICPSCWLQPGERFLDVGAGWGGCCCGRPRTTTSMPPASRYRATSMPMSTA